MKKIVLLVISIVSFQFVNAQTPTWMWGQCSGGQTYSGGVGVAVSQSGHLYLGARFGGTCKFGTVTATGPGANNVIHGRFDTSGVANCKWLTPNNFTSGEDYVYDFTMDNRENTYLTGTTNSGYNGWYVDKCDSSGHIIWSYNPANTTGQNVQMPAGYAVAIDESSDSNNVFVVGAYSSSITIGSTVLTSVGDNDIFLAKLDSNGTPIWAVSAGGTGLDGGRGIAIDQYGYIYMCGSYNGTANFGPFTTPASSGTYPSLFVAKYDRSGNALWVNTASNAGFDNDYYTFWRFETMKVDSCGNGYVTGTFYNTAQFGSTTLNSLSGTNGNIYVAKILTNGNWEWAKSAGGTGSDGGQTVALDKYSDVYVSGSMGSSTAQFGNLTATNTSAIGGTTVFVAKYSNSTGDAQWVLTQEGKGSTGSQGLFVDTHGYVYVSGSIADTCTFGSSVVGTSLLYGNTYVSNILLAKIDTVPSRRIIPVVAKNYCPGTPVILPYTTIGTFNNGNIFTAQLSDSSGSFANPTDIGDTALTGTGGIRITIPNGTPAGTYLIRVISSDPAGSSYANGCGAYYNGGVYINDFYVTIGGNLTIGVTPNSIDTICKGASIKLTASGGGTYLWNTSDTSASITESPTVNTTYTVTVNNGGCQGDTTISVTVDSATALTILPASPTVCNGSSVVLYVNGTGNFTWNPATGLSSTTGDTVTVNTTANVTYTVTGTVSGGCPSNGMDDVSVVPAPNKPVISRVGDVLTSSATQGNQWFVNDTSINGATNQSYTIATAGCYSVNTINPANGCSATSDTTCAVPTGINQLSVIGNQLSVFPNPTTGSIFILINSSVQNTKDWNLEVTDVLGRCLYTTLFLSYNNEIDLSDFSGGVYFITIKNKTDRVVYPIVKQN